MAVKPSVWPWPRNPDDVAREAAEDFSGKRKAGLPPIRPRCLNTKEFEKCRQPPPAQNKCDLCGIRKAV